MTTAAAAVASLISPTDTWEIWTALLGSASVGYYANKTKIGGALSGPVCAMLCGAVLANVGVLPPPAGNMSTFSRSHVPLPTSLSSLP